MKYPSLKNGSCQGRKTTRKAHQGFTLWWKPTFNEDFMQCDTFTWAQHALYAILCG